MSKESAVYLWHVFLVKPFAALSILICLATILSLFSLERRRPQHPADRFLIGFLGLLSVYQGMRILESAGLMTSLSTNTRLDDAIDLIITVFYLLAALLLRLSSVNHLDAESALRLARAAPPRTSRAETPIEAPRLPLPVERLSAVLPKVSDSAFRLYAWLFLHPDASKGRIVIRGDELESKLERPREEIEAGLRELERAGAIAILRSSGIMTVDVNVHAVSAEEIHALPALH